MVVLNKSYSRDPENFNDKSQIRENSAEFRENGIKKDHENKDSSKGGFIDYLQVKRGMKTSHQKNLEKKGLKNSNNLTASYINDKKQIVDKQRKLTENPQDKINNDFLEKRKLRIIPVINQSRKELIFNNKSEKSNSTDGKRQITDTKGQLTEECRNPETIVFEKKKKFVISPNKNFPNKEPVLQKQQSVETSSYKLSKIYPNQKNVENTENKVI